MKKLLIIPIFFITSICYCADIDHPFDLGQTKTIEHGKERIDTKKCLHCNRQLCICPSRQTDGSWKERDLVKEIDELKTEVNKLKEAV